MPMRCESDSDCPATVTYRDATYPVSCVEGICEAERPGAENLVVTVNYTSKSYSQGIGSGCYDFSLLHAMQTKVAYFMDAANGGPWVWPPDERNRGIRLSSAPRYQCSPGAKLPDFLTRVGLVEDCVEPFPDWSQGAGRQEGFPPYPEVCGFCGSDARYLEDYAGADAWDPSCSPLQQSIERVLVYRVDEIVAGPSQFGQGIEDRKERLWVQFRQELRTYGPIKIGVKWGVRGIRLNEPSPGYVLADGLELQELSCPGAGASDHAIAVVGYREDDDGSRFLYVQNSSVSHPMILRLDFNAWSDDATTCQLGDIGWDSIERPGNVLPPVQYEVGTAPYEALCVSRDVDLDGLPDDQDPDLDGDGAFNRWDLAPYHPMLGVDTDQDGWPDNQYRSNEWDIHRLLGRWHPVCRPFCETLVARGFLGSAQACKDLCQDWDRCMTLQVKNQDDPPCDWKCAHMDDGEENQGDWGSCGPDWRNPACHDLYANGDNAEGDPSTRIGEACLGKPSPSRISWHQTMASVLYHEEEDGLPRLLAYCDVRAVDVTYWALGGTTWDATTQVNFLLDRGPRQAVTDLGACACSVDATPGETEESLWSEYCARGTCPNAEPSGRSWKWDPIHSATCRWWPRLAAEGDPDECRSLSDSYAFREEPAQFRRFSWIWGGETTADTGRLEDLAGNLVKVAVSWRDATDLQDKSRNVVVPAPRPFRFPEGPRYTNCRDLNEVLADQAVLVDAAAEAAEVGRVWPRLFGLVQTLDQARTYLVGYSRFLDLPVAVREVSFPAGASFSSLDLVASPARLEASLLAGAGGDATAGESVVFYLEQAEGPVAGPEPRLWVGLFDRPEAPVFPAEELFGPSEVQPPAMTRPRIAFDPVRGRLLLVGGGEEGRAEAWTYAPATGRWERLDAELPPGLEGVSLVLDPIDKTIYLMGQDEEGTGRLWEFATWKDDFLELDVPQAAARGWAALAVDRASHRLLVYGGMRQGELLGDLWSAALPVRDWRQEWAGGENGPEPRRDAVLIPDGRLGRQVVAGGVTADGPEPFQAWSLTAQGWIRTPLSQGPEPDGLQQVHLYHSARYVYQGDEASVAQGLVTVAQVESSEPCVAVEARDSAGRLLSGDLACRSGTRQVAFWALPGERYSVEVFPGPGFPAGAVADVRVSFRTADLREVAHRHVGPARDLALGARCAVGPTADAALLLRPARLWSAPPRRTSVRLWGASVGGPASRTRIDALATDRPAPAEPVRNELLVADGGRLAVLTRRGLQLFDLPDGQVQPAGRLRYPGLASGLAAMSGRDLLLAGAGRWTLEQVHVVGDQAPEAVAGWRVGALGRRVAYGQARAYLAGLTRVRALDLARDGQVAWTLDAGGLVTALAVARDFLLVATPGLLRVYDLSGHEPVETDAQALWGIAEGLLVQGSSLAVGECGPAEWLRCVLGLGRCRRRGRGEVFRLDESGRLEPVGSYPSDWRWPAYVRTWASLAYGLKGRRLVVQEVAP